VVGNAVALGLITPILTSLIYASDLEITFLQSFAAGISNTFVLVVVGIPLLTLLARRFKKHSNLTEEA
jgi:uncharacterized membrane protein